MTDIEQIEREAPKYKEAIELMAEEVAVIRVENQDILNRTFVLGQGDYPTGREIIASTANEIRKLRRALSDETARAVALAAERDALRAGIKGFLTGDADYMPRAKMFSSDGTTSKHDQCPHGVDLYNDCETCVGQYFEALLARAALSETDT